MESRIPATRHVRSNKPLFRSRRQYQPDEGTGTSSSSSDAFIDEFTEPPLNVPKAWRKAQKYDGWMQKILHPETTLPVVEASPSTQNLTPPESVSGSPRKEPETPMWNPDTDFTAGSLDMSPQLKLRTPAAKSPKTYVHTPAGRIRSSVANSRKIFVTVQTPVEQSRRDEKLEELKRLEAEVPITEETQMDGSTPISLLSQEYTEEQYKKHNPEGWAMLKRPRRKTDPDEMHDTLRQLSRISASKTPSPVEEAFKENGLFPKSSKPEFKYEDRAEIYKPETKDRGRAVPAKSESKDEDPEDRITAEARLFELQDNKSSRSTSPMIPNVQPTPRVTGAYIDTPTPGPKKRDVSLSPFKREISPDTTPRQRRNVINTARPVSAAEDVLKLQGQLQDNTLDEFANFVAESFSDRETDPLEENENEILNRINRSMKITSSSIRDARQGIERLEQQVSSSVAAASKNPTNIETLVIKVAQLEQQVTSASVAIRSNPDEPNLNIHLNLKFRVPKIWTYNAKPRPDARRNWKLTWIGFFLVAFLTWLMVETATCATYCHPKESTVNNWSFSDPFFPWAIPTKLDQLTGRIVSSAIEGILDIQDGLNGVPYSANDWWMGRDGPVGIVNDNERYEYFDDDIMI